MQGIYKITNLISDKSYIGQSVNIESRFKSHITNSKNKKYKEYNYPLYKAFRKHGTDNFKFEVLELVPNKKDLTKKELYYYNLLKPNYNQIIPNNARSNDSKHVYQWDLSANFIAEYKSVAEASRQVGVVSSAIFRVLKGERKSSAYSLWTLTKEKPKKYVDTYYKKGKKIYQYDLQGNKIGEYNTLGEASRQTKIPISSICHNAQGKFNAFTNYMWSYENKKNIPISEKYVPTSRKVVKKDLDGNILDVYESVKQAALEHGVCKTVICAAANKTQKTSAGFIWDYYIEGGHTHVTN